MKRAPTARARASAIQPALNAGRRIAAWAILFGAAVTLLYLAPSLFMMQVYDRVLVSQSVTTLILLSVILLVALAALAILDGLRTRILARVSLRFERLIAPLLLEAGLKADVRAQGANARHILREFDVLRQSLAGPAPIAVLDLLWSPLYFLVCFLINPWIGALVLLGALALGVLAFLNERALKRSIDEIVEIAPAANVSQDAEAAAADVISALGMRRALVRRQLLRRSTLNEAQKHALFRSVQYATIVKFTRLALQSGVLGLGAFLAVEGAITPGALIAASIIGGRALQPIEQVVSSWRQLVLMGKAFAAVREVLDAEPSRDGAIDLPMPDGNLRFDKVFVRIPNSEKWALSGIGFSLRAGEILGVLGQSGVGKSTLARVAVGAIAPDSGVVRLDDASLADWESDRLGAYLGYLPQDICLIEGTVAENIRRFGAREPANEAAIDAATVAAAKAARVHAMILSLPGGYAFKLGPYGRGVSMGQAQRIALARALYANPNLIVLDEPNAHLDAEGEAGLIEALKEARARGAAIMVVAHRAGVMGIADKLLVLAEGRIEAFGPRDEVLASIAEKKRGATVAPMRTRERQA